MPFTPVHALIVLPLKRLKPEWWDLTGLIVGSLVPDFEYFLLLQGKTVISHTWWGIWLFDLPVSLVVAIVFHWIVKRPLVAHLPAPFDARFYSWSKQSWSLNSSTRIAKFSFSTIVGVISHILWDGFTHADDIFVRQLPWLSATYQLATRKVALYDLLQYGCSLLGMIVLAVMLLMIYRNERAANFKRVSISEKVQYWSIVSTSTLIIILLRYLSLPLMSNFLILVELIIAMITGSIVGLIGTSQVFKSKSSQ